MSNELNKKGSTQNALRLRRPLLIQKSLSPKNTFLSLKFINKIKKNRRTNSSLKKPKFTTGKLSILNSISIDNNLKIKFKKIPNLEEDLEEIKQIKIQIKNKRFKIMENLNRIHNTILINESKMFRNNIYLTGGGMGLKLKNSNKSDNRSIISDNECKNESFSGEKKINNCAKSANRESNKSTENINKGKKTIYPLLQIPRNKSMTNFHELKMKDIESNGYYFGNNEKLRIKINETMLNSPNVIGGIAKLERKVRKLRTITDAKSLKLENLLLTKKKLLKKIIIN
jgi:hypothetical protein